MGRGKEGGTQEVAEWPGNKHRLQRKKTTAGVVKLPADTDSDQLQAEDSTGRAPLAKNKTPQRQNRKRGRSGITSPHSAPVVNMV